MTSAITIDAALADANLLGAALGDLGSWQTWRTVLKAAFGLSFNREDARTFASIAGSRQPPGQRVRELWAIIGRRSGKSRIAALVGAYIAGLVDHRGKLSPGEVGTVLILAASKSQAATVFNYARAFFEASPLLAQLVEEVTADEIRLKGNIVLAVHTNNYRTVRGRTLLACIFDEVGFWRDETSTQPDVETYRAILPALATTGGMLVAISSPYAQRGLLYTKHQQSFGRDDAEVLVIQAPTVVFNPSIDAAIIERAKAEDPEAARSEWEAEFRGDLATFVDRAIVEACVTTGVRERAFQTRFRYFAHCDPSGGQNDSMTIAIAHAEEDRAVLDVAQEWRAPFAPPEVVRDIVQVLRGYRCTAVSGDAYAAQWVSEEFRRNGITYRHAEQNRSELFLGLLPQLTATTAVLLDIPRLTNQLATLERRTGRSGRDSVDHMRGAHDDLAVAVAGALTAAASESAKLAAREAWRARQPARQLYANVGYAEVKRRHRDWGAAAQPRRSDEGLRQGSVPWPAPRGDPFDPCINAYSTDGWKQI
jgi:hypothetical protein